MGGGRVSVAPVGVVWIGQVERSWLRRDWAQERAVEARVAFRFEGLVGGLVVLAEVVVLVLANGRNGFVSMRRRLPRAKA